VRVDEADRHRLRRELLQDGPQAARPQLVRDLIREHANDAEPGKGRIDGRLRRVDRKARARLDG
jgi:hypothetical protein